MCIIILKSGKSCGGKGSPFCGVHTRMAQKKESESDSHNDNIITPKSSTSSDISDSYTTMCRHQDSKAISDQVMVPPVKPLDLFEAIFDMKTGGPNLDGLKTIEGSFYERFDNNKLAFVVNNLPEIVKLYRPEAQNKLPVDKYYHASSEGECPVTYLQNKALHGRYNARGSISAQNMVREVRHSIFVDYYVDMDIDNAHPVFTVWLCDKLHISCNSMADYVRNRDLRLKELMDANGYSRGKAKMIYLAINYGGTSSYKDVPNKTPHLLAYFKESKAIQKAVFEKLPYFSEQTRLQCKRSGKKYNFEGSCLSHVCCFIENQVLARIVEYLVGQIGHDAVHNSVLCFDGVMIPKGSHEDRFLPELESIFSAMGLPIKLSMKKFEPIDLSTMGYDSSVKYEVEQSIVCTSTSGVPAIFDPNDKRVFGHGFGVPPVNDTCDTDDHVRATIALISNGGSSFFCTKVLGVGGSVEYNRVSVDKLRKNPLAVEMDIHGISSVVSIGYRACKTPDIVYDRLDFVPFAHRTMYNWADRKVFNTFGGFVHDFSPEFKFDHAKIERFLNHVRDVWCSGNVELFECVMKTFALYVQRPEQKTKICLVVTGREGLGKNIVTDILRNFIIGLRYVCETPSMAKITGRFNSAIENMLLCVLNEAANVSAEGANECQEVLKDRIDAETILIERKGIDPYCISDRCNYICFSNNNYVIRSSTELRRFVFLEASDARIGDADHFSDLWEDFSVRGGGIHLYHYLMSLDVSDFVPQRDFPSTGLKDQMRADALDKPIQWFISCLNNEVPSHESFMVGFNPVKVLLDRFNVWCGHRGENAWTSNRFGRALSKFLGDSERSHVCKIRIRGYTLGDSLKQILSSYTRRPELFLE